MIATRQKPLDRKSMPEYPFDIGSRWVKDGSVDVQVPLTEEDFLHPEEGDRFLITRAHTRMAICLQLAIEYVHRDDPGVQVFGEHRVDWQSSSIRPMGPDVVVFGDSQIEWDDSIGTVPVVDSGFQPLFVAEVTSPSTRLTDIERKPTLYHRAGVPYYLIFDLWPPGGVAPQLLGFRATRKEFVPMKENAEYGIWVPTVQMWFKLDEDRVVAHTAAKERILDNRELVERLEEETERAEIEKQRADAETQRADAEKHRAETEKQRADALEKELAELRAKIANPAPKKNGNSNGR